MRATRKIFLPFSPPRIGEEEIAEVVDTLRSDWITTGPKVTRFEEAFTAAVGAPSALALSSCTAALHVALTAAGVGPGDCVITSPMTFCSTAHTVEHAGARPLLVDVEPQTLLLDLNQVGDSLAQARRDGVRIKAIIPVHLYGHPCDLDALADIAREYGCAVVEDAAHALPARYKGKTIGSFANEFPVPLLTCFSFYATKNMTTSEGGMLTGTKDLIDQARTWSLHGMSRGAWKRYGSDGSWRYDVVAPGFKYNMTDIQAAIGLHQLRKLSEFHRRRKEIAARYDQAFCELDELEIPVEQNWAEHARHLYVLRLRLDRLTISRDEFVNELRRRNIGTSVHFIPVHLFTYYRERYQYSPQDFPIASAEFERIVSLPCSPAMSGDDVDDVIAAVTSVIQQNSVRQTSAAAFSAAGS
jgi:dTDP-4-amino-4,6-dideoxygalactose transaminase